MPRGGDHLRMAGPPNIVGSSEPATMAAIAAPRPTNCGGSSASGAASSAAIQPASPKTTDSSAPWGVARVQNIPKARGVKAATSVTL